MFTPDDVVHTYTRDDAIQDGVLVDVSHPAKQAGFTIPLALTARVFSECVYWPETEAAVQDETGRLWDVLFMAAVAARAAARRGQGGRINFELHVVPRGGRTPELTTLSLHVGPGDHGEPVATILAPDED
ncbi:MAG: hypothetical protein AMXMBFR59_12160 [Rhodanobacteraceae bacterium]